MMYRYDYDRGDWAWMTVMMPLMWLLLIGLTVWLVARLTHGPGGGNTKTPPEHRETPEEIVDRRFAAGEIDAETHAAARKQLKEHGR